MIVPSGKGSFPSRKALSAHRCQVWHACPKRGAIAERGRSGRRSNAPRWLRIALISRWFRRTSATACLPNGDGNELNASYATLPPQHQAECLQSDQRGVTMRIVHILEVAL